MKGLGFFAAATILAVLIGVTLSPAWRQEAVDLTSSPAERGREIAASAGCTACHTLDGSPGIGPSWLGSLGQPRTFKDGRTVVVDSAYLRRSMLQPGVEVVAGFDNLMLPATLTEAQIADVIAFIETLDGGMPQ